MLTIGADPEIFLQDKHGKFISAIGKFGGTKDKPRPMTELGEGFFIQEDNVAVEFNIPPTDLYAPLRFVQNIQTAVREIEKRAGALKLRLAIIASAEFDADQLQEPAARRFGCDPDFNVWSLKMNRPPHARNKALRSCGGHIHIGGGIDDKIGMGRALDLFVGCPSIVHEEDKQRRLLYGKAGAIRDKPYGLEYRTLSNFWIKSAGMTEMIISQVKAANEFCEMNKTIPEEDGKKIIHCINDANVDLLRELTRKYGLRY